MFSSFKNKEINKSQIRESNIELLRIISMVFITIYHYIVHGGILESQHYTTNKLVGLFLYTGGRVGVNVFILIMGYFMINSKFKIRKLLKLIFQVYFYSIFLLILSMYRLNLNFEVINVKPAFTPILRELYWFATSYVLVYILSPFLNKAIKTMGKENCKKLIIICGMVLSLVPTIFRNKVFVSTFFTWFIYMYIIGAYIKLYSFEFKEKNTAKIISLMFFVVAYITIIIQIILNKKLNLDLDIGYYLSLYSLLGVIGAIGIFMCFKNMHIKNSKVINCFGKSSFAVYLLQDNLFYRNVFWHMDCKTLEFVQSPIYLFLLHLIICTIGIFIIATVIETIRINLIEKPISKIKFWDKYLDKIDNWMYIE